MTLLYPRIPYMFFLSCSDSLLGERGVGPWLRHVWAEGTNSCRSSFCSPDVRKFNCKTQTYAGLSWMINLIMTKICPHTEMHASHLCLAHAPTCIHSAGVLFSTDRCCVCYQLVNSPVKHWLYFCSVVCGSRQVGCPSMSFQSILFYPWHSGHCMVSREWCITLSGRMLLIPCWFELCARCERLLICHHLHWMVLFLRRVEF